GSSGRRPRGRAGARTRSCSCPVSFLRGSSPTRRDLAATRLDIYTDRRNDIFPLGREFFWTMPFLYTLVILLAAAVVAVPVAKRLGFGSVLGYLGTAPIMGPAGPRLVTDVHSIPQASELAAIIMIFFIGL